MRVAILDDAQRVAAQSADWSRLNGRATLTTFRDSFKDEDDAAHQLADFDILLPMRERTPLTASLIVRLGRLKMVALTGARSPSLDIPACTQRGSPVRRAAPSSISTCPPHITHVQWLVGLNRTMLSDMNAAQVNQLRAFYAMPAGGGDARKRKLELAARIGSTL